jgi:hypothetical protein
VNRNRVIVMKSLASVINARGRLLFGNVDRVAAKRILRPPACARPKSFTLGIGADFHWPLAKWTRLSGDRNCFDELVELLKRVRVCAFNRAPFTPDFKFTIDRRQKAAHNDFAVDGYNFDFSRAGMFKVKE